MPPGVDAKAGHAIAPLWHVPARRRGRKVFVDLVHDVAIGDPELALREGLDDIERIKRDTAAGMGAGMGVDQGKADGATMTALFLAPALLRRVGKRAEIWADRGLGAQLGTCLAAANGSAG